MAPSKVKILNVILISFVFTYLLVSIKLFLLDSTQRQADSDIALDVGTGICHSSCTFQCVQNNTYREMLNIFFYAARDYKGQKVMRHDSKCEVLMDEDVLERAVNYGLPKHYAIFKENKIAQYHNQTIKKVSKSDCRVIRYSNANLPMTSLASFPGSGNTWVRHLLQQATGMILFENFLKCLSVCEMVNFFNVL